MFVAFVGKKRACKICPCLARKRPPPNLLLFLSSPRALSGLALSCHAQTLAVIKWGCKTLQKEKEEKRRRTTTIAKEAPSEQEQQSVRKKGEISPRIQFSSPCFIGESTTN